MDIDKSIQAAFKYLQAGNLHQAENICWKILEVQPDNADAMHFLGIIFYSSGNYDLAIQNIKKSLHFNSTNAEAYFDLGNAYHEKGQLDDAITNYQKAIEIEPNFVDAYNNLGLAVQDKGKLKDAIIYYQKAIEINPDFADAYNNLGIAFYAGGQFDKALIYFQKAIQFNPNLADPYNNLGKILQGKGQLDKSITFYQKALKLNPDLLSASDNVNKLLYPDEFDIHDIALACNYLETIFQNHTHLDEAIAQNQKISHMPILISVCVFNRKKITQLSLAQTKRYKTSYCHLEVCNDHSTEYDNSFLEPYADEVIQLPAKIGIDNLRWYQFRKFLETDFDFLYMTDNDIIHDPQYVPMLEALYEIGNKRLPVCLYNSQFHMDPNIILFYKSGLILKETAPGFSMFYDRKMVDKIVAKLDKVGIDNRHISWDYKASSYLCLPYITPERSFLEHYGAGGKSNIDYERDRAINPTKYLQERRESILKYLIENIDMQINF